MTTHSIANETTAPAGVQTGSFDALLDQIGRRAAHPPSTYANLPYRFRMVRTSQDEIILYRGGSSRSATIGFVQYRPYRWLLADGEIGLITKVKTLVREVAPELLPPPTDLKELPY